MLTGNAYIPETITVHLGSPDSNAQNITVDFPSYIKNVASCEIYPTWPDSSLKANIYAILSFVLNRLFTQWYRSKGYPFDITSSSKYDRTFINGREIFENISLLVDEIFNSYVKRKGFDEPLFTTFNSSAQNDGNDDNNNGSLSQWGSVELAERGNTHLGILQKYFGSDIDIVKNVPVKSSSASFPSDNLSEGASGQDVRYIQMKLNRISRNYPSIPKIPIINGIFDSALTSAISEFQNVFGLKPTGIINEATWYKISYVFSSIRRLAKVSALSLTLNDKNLQFSEQLHIGMQSQSVYCAQIFLTLIGSFFESIYPVDPTGYFGEETERAVQSFQHVFSLPENGIIDFSTWNEMFRSYMGIINSVPPDTSVSAVPYSGFILKEGSNNDYVRILQEYLCFVNKSFPDIPAVRNTGFFGPLTKTSVIAFQKMSGITQNGIVGTFTWNELSSLFCDLKSGFDKRDFQFPGYSIISSIQEA